MEHNDQEPAEIAGSSPTTDRAPETSDRPARIRSRTWDDPLAEEAKLYAAMKPDLLDREGQYAVIKGTELVGVYPTLEEVEDVATMRFGMEPVFVRQIRRVESPAILNILLD